MTWRVEATITCTDEARAATLISLLSQLARANDAVPVELRAHPVPDLTLIDGGGGDAA